jgi:hypothetical protein
MIKVEHNITNKELIQILNKQFDTNETIELIKGISDFLDEDFVNEMYIFFKEKRKYIKNYLNS